MTHDSAQDAIVELQMTYPSRGENSLPQPILDYQYSIERACDKLRNLKHVYHTVSSASRFADKSLEWWNDNFALMLNSVGAADVIADRLVSIVRRVGIKHEHKFRLRKNVPGDEGGRDEYFRKIYATRDTKWVLYRAPGALKPKRKPKTEFPGKLEYLAQMAERCYGTGGDDIWQLFARDTELRSFIRALSSSDQVELIQIYQTIVRKKHHQWLHKWMLNNEDDIPEWVDRMGWLLAVLDRLRQGGLLSKTRGAAKKTVLVYWDDYLCGEPYSEER